MAQNSARSSKAEHLKPHQFKKGQSGNPGGRPKSKILSEAYKKILETPISKSKDAKTYAEVIAEALAKAARKGGVQSASEMADRTEGKPRQAYEVKLSIFDELSERIAKARRRSK